MTTTKEARSPAWYPAWAQELGQVYSAGTTSTFLLHGNVDDLVRVAAGQPVEYLALSEFLASQVFGAFDVVLHYDLTRPPRALAGRDRERLQEMNAHVDRYLGKLQELPRDPTQVLALLNRYLELMLVGKSDEQRPKVAVVLEYAQLLLPSTQASQTSGQLAANLATVLNWAKNPYIKRVNFAFCLVSEKLSDLHEALVRNPHTERIELPYPDEAARLAFIDWMRAGRPAAELSDVAPELLAKLTAGLTLVNLQGLLHGALRHQRPISLAQLKQFKKEMIEGTCQGMVEFVEPKHTLEMVVGHGAAKQRLEEDAALIRDNHLEAAPMGYLLCGPVGTGKSFLAECYAGSIGIPCLKLLNFRSKYVGETEGNLEKILKMLRAMGPVVVMIDEADAALGDRQQEGDSGTSGRVFAQIASQMGDTAYRGRIIWFLMTCRPDLLPIDIKRQGRAEVHLALFYPETPDEIRQMFVILGRKLRLPIRVEDVPTVGDLKLSGADIEGIVNRARRLMLMEKTETVTAAQLRRVIDDFIPSAEDAEKRMQELGAVLECTELPMLPERYQTQVRTAAGKATLLRQFEELRLQVEGR
ncbi:MAG: ATP-binding protein [Deltaproteobacteria bacterium]|nr:ATP-binding protein [Deltaproteobacteria bacterium]